MDSADQTRRFGRYEIEGELGSGGMSIVYRAYDPKMKRTVSLKLLLPALALSEKQRTRFFNEAYMAADLYHENICTIFEVDEIDDTPYIAMAFIKGQEVSDLIAERNLEIADALNISVQCCRGLRALHEIGVVHRDIKPSNIMVDREGRVRIMDFGIAKQQGRIHSGGRTDLTKTGTTPGTVAYMSPEQAKGDQVDERSDLWSLGVVLYEMLSGERPFAGKFDGTTTEAIINNDPIPIGKFRADLPKSVSDIIDRALEKDVTKRYQSAESMLADIEEALADNVEVEAVTARTFNYWLATSAIAFVGLLAGLSYVLATWAIQSEASACPEFASQDPATGNQGIFARADTLLVTSYPSNATVSIDGEPVGVTDKIGMLLVARPRMAGSRQISVCATGYMAVTRDVAVSRGGRNEYEVVLAPVARNSPWGDYRVLALLAGVLLAGILVVVFFVRGGRKQKSPPPEKSVSEAPRRVLLGSTPTRRTVPPTLPDTRPSSVESDNAEMAGSYFLGEQIGQGTYSVVYEARSDEGRPFAVKTLRDEYLDNEDMFDAFKRSMEVLEEVQRTQPSPTLLSVYEVGVEGPRPYAILELLRGPTLLEVVDRKGALGVNAALEIARQVCYGLKAIHKTGNVHGDVNLEH
ncbi:MAG: serine/threonine protein kinase, partial [Rhodothermia bacterium]